MSDEENSQSGEAPPPAPDGEAAAAADTKKTVSNPDNPFDMGVGGLDFEEVKKRQERAKEEARAKEAEKQNQDDDIKVIKIGSLFDDDPIPIVKETPKKKDSSAPSAVEESESESEDSEDEEERRLAELEAQRKRERDANTIRVGDKTLSKWPWDHYHMVQEEYWKRYYEREEQARLKQQQAEDSDSSTSVSISSSDEDEDDLSSSESGSDDSSSSEESSSSSDSENSETSSQRMDRKRAARRAKKREERRQRKKQEKKRLKRLNRDTEKEQEKRRKLRQKAMEEERQAGLHDLKSDILVFERPQDPPELSQAVKNLNLTEFEAVAKERAITMISTWLFDAGLVQELMATKKVSKDGKPVEEDDERKKEKKVKIEIVKKEGKKKETKGVDSGPRRTKMDIEIEKLEKAARSQLELITMRLNKAVAASGNEVQDLVNSVINTKSELVRLRKTSSMINDAAGKGVDGVAGMAASQTTFAINKYPHLKYAINARKNLAKCFRELTFFSQIPENCARLSDMLNSAEWSEQEWTTLRTVCREHVQLEIFLVEAEAGMRKQQQEEDDADDDEDDPKKRRRSSIGAGISRKAFDVGLPHNNDEVDRFLKEHVQTVWDLGNEIRLKMFSGIASAFELSINSPESVVAIVEAIEIYESANQDYQSVHGGEGGKGAPRSLRFTDIRNVALAELYKDMQEQGNELFEKHTGGIEEDDENYQNKMFSGILLAANELSSEIGFVAEHMAPCFPPDWSIEIIWTACVANICAEKILNTIGGEQGEKLPVFGTQQLLQLVAWVENFRDTVEESFPDIAGLASNERKYFEKFPKLSEDGGRTVNIAGAKDVLAFYNNMLWDAHDSGKVEFIFRTKETAEEFLRRTYLREDHEKMQLTDGTLTTSLVGDIYGYIAFVLKTLRERLTRKSEAMIQLVGIVFKALYDSQKQYRDHFLGDFECCCAGSNDFVQMSDKCEDIVTEIRAECTLSDQANESLDNVAGALLGLYASDAVHAAQKVSYFIFQDIYDCEDITPLFFTLEWLDEMQNNDLANQIAITIEDYMTDLENYLDEIMIQKAIQALVTKFVNFYVEQLLQRASAHKSSRDSHFADNKRALERMNGDINLIREFFQDIAGEENRPLRDAIDNEFEFFETIHEIMTYAAGFSDDDIRDYIYAFQQRIKKYEITYAVIGDLYHLVQPSEEKNVYEEIEKMKEDLESLEDNSPPDPAQEHAKVPGLSLDDVLKKHVEETKEKRNRPGENVIAGMFSGFLGGGK